MLIDNGFCRTGPAAPTTYTILEEGAFMNPPAHSSGNEKNRFYEYMLLRKESGTFTSKSEAKTACESVGMNLVVPYNIEQNDFWKDKSSARKGIILGISWIVDGWYSHESNERIQYHDFVDILSSDSGKIPAVT